MLRASFAGFEKFFNKPIDIVGISVYDMRKSIERGGRKLCTTISSIFNHLSALTSVVDECVVLVQTAAVPTAQL